MKCYLTSSSLLAQTDYKSILNNYVVTAKQKFLHKFCLWEINSYIRINSWGCQLLVNVTFYSCEIVAEFHKTQLRMLQRQRCNEAPISMWFLSVKKVLWTLSHVYLWHTLWFNAKNMSLSHAKMAHVRQDLVWRESERVAQGGKSNLYEISVQISYFPTIIWIILNI